MLIRRNYMVEKSHDRWLEKNMKLYSHNNKSAFLRAILNAMQDGMGGKPGKWFFAKEDKAK